MAAQLDETPVEEMTDETEDHKVRHGHCRRCWPGVHVVTFCGIPLKYRPRRIPRMIPPLNACVVCLDMKDMMHQHSKEN